MKSVCIDLLLSVALSVSAHPGRMDAEGIHAGKLLRYCSMTHAVGSPGFPGRFRMMQNQKWE